MHYLINIELMIELNDDTDYVKIINEAKIFNRKSRNEIIELIRFNYNKVNLQDNSSLILRGSYHREDANQKSDIDLGLITRENDFERLMILKTQLNDSKIGKLFSIKNYTLGTIDKMKWSLSFWTTITNHRLILNSGDQYQTYTAICLNTFKEFSSNDILKLYQDDLYIKSCTNRHEVKHYKYRIGGILDYEYYLLIILWLKLNKKNDALLKVNQDHTYKLYEYLKAYKYLFCDQDKCNYWFFQESILEEICYELKRNLLKLITLI